MTLRDWDQLLALATGVMTICFSLGRSWKNRLRELVLPKANVTEESLPILANALAFMSNQSTSED